MSETELQQLLESLNREELEQPKKGAWHIRTTTEQPTEQDAEFSNVFSQFDSSEFKAPKSGAWDKLKDRIPQSSQLQHIFAKPDSKSSRLTQPEQITVKTTDLQELFQSIDPTIDINEFISPSTGAWNIRESAKQSLTKAHAPLPEKVTVRTTDLQEIFRSIDPSFDSKDFDSPKSGVWNIKESAKQVVNTSHSPLPEKVTLRSTDLQQIFKKIDPAKVKETPRNKWDFTNMPREVKVKTTELQKLLENIDSSSFKSPQQKWHFERMINTAKNGVVTVKTTELQELFETIGEQEEYKKPQKGEWQITTAKPPSQENLAKIQLAMSNVLELKEHVSEMIREQEKKIDEKGFMTTKEKEIMQSLREKEEKLGNIVEELEAKQPRDPKLLGLNLFGDSNPFSTKAVETFDLAEFRTPDEGKWDYKQAFHKFIEEHTEAAAPSPTTISPEFVTTNSCPIFHY